MSETNANVIHVGVYVEDDPHTMNFEVFIQALDGRTLLFGDVAKKPEDYIGFGKTAMDNLKPTRCLEKVVIHPGKTNDPNNFSDPITNSLYLEYIAKGMAQSKDYNGKVSINSEVIELPMR